MKIGIFVDAENITRSGGYAMRYDVLKEYCSRYNEPLRLNTYLTVDVERSKADKEYREKHMTYLSILRSFGYKVITKAIKWFEDENGTRYGKANADLDMAVDILTQSQNLDKVYLLTGDGDFTRVVQAVQNMGARVELIAFRYISRELLHEVDQFTSGYLIPNLLSVEGQKPEDWGKDGFRVRGVCYSVHEGFGFLRVYNRDCSGSFEVFSHFSELPEGHFVNPEDVFEFTLIDAERGLVAKEMDVLYKKIGY